VDEGPSSPKLRLHYAIQQNMRDEELLPEVGREAMLTRWALVGELVLPLERRALVTITSSSDGSDLHSWDARGLFITALGRSLRKG
jgi:hypothetical protein